MSKWIIRDWMGNDVKLGDRDEFTDFADARGEISEFAYDLTAKAIKAGKYDYHSDEHYEALEAIEGDLYAINVDDNGKELPDTGQYSM